MGNARVSCAVGQCDIAMDNHLDMWQAAARHRHDQWDDVLFRSTGICAFQSLCAAPTTSSAFVGVRLHQRLLEILHTPLQLTRAADGEFWSG